jgi:hypothetical protein
MPKPLPGHCPPPGRALRQAAQGRGQWAEVGTLPDLYLPGSAAGAAGVQRQAGNDGGEVGVSWHMWGGSFGV